MFRRQGGTFVTHAGGSSGTTRITGLELSVWGTLAGRFLSRSQSHWGLQNFIFSLCSCNTFSGRGYPHWVWCVCVWFSFEPSSWNHPLGGWAALPHSGPQGTHPCILTRQNASHTLVGKGEGEIRFHGWACVLITPLENYSVQNLVGISPKCNPFFCFE